jgi:DmsE family decaheme c-type cytochrome
MRILKISGCLKFTSCLLVLILSAGSSLAQEPEAGSRVKRTPIYTENGTVDCLRCHSGEKMRAVATSPHGNEKNEHAPAAGRGCESCHGPGSIHISRAHGGRGFPPLTTFGRGSGVAPREEQLEACMSCHAREGAGMEVIQFIGSPHDRRTINCSTCHTVHAQTDPVREKDHQAATCNRCHRRQINEHPRFEDKSIDFDALSCWTCHDVHQAVAGVSG